MVETRPNGADNLSGWLDGHTRWPCQNPDCRKRVVDPDSPFQYCSKTCANAVKSGKVANRDRYYQAMEKARAANDWRRRFVRTLDAGLWPR